MVQDKDESVISHFEALRAALLRSFAAVALLLPLCLWFSPKALNFIVNILLGDSEVTLNYFSPMEVFILQIKLALLMSVILAFPYIAKQIWGFILPALYENERKFVKTASLASALLFVSGAAFCLFFVVPLIIKFGISFSGGNVRALFGIAETVSLALWLSVAFGLMFQVPLATHLLIRWGIISYVSVSSKRPYVIVGLLICAAILTPPDVVSQILLFVPAYLLFELGLLFSRKNRQDSCVK